MKILLFVPPISTWHRVDDGPTLGIGYVAALLKKHGNKVDIFDLVARPIRLEAIPKMINTQTYQIIGITSFSYNYNCTSKIADLAKQDNPNALVVVGGSHVTFRPQQTLQNSQSIDIVVMGEGEHTMLELVSKYEATQDTGCFKEIKGICYRDKNGSIRMNPPRPLIKDLDTLPSPYVSKVFDMSMYRTVRLITQRGCPFRCGFCSNQLFGQSVRTHSLKYIVSDIECCRSIYQKTNFFFEDDILTLNKKRTIDLCKMIIEQGLDIHFWCQTRADIVDPEILKWLRKAGCISISFALESANSRTIGEVIQKTDYPYKWRRAIRRAVSCAKEEGMKVGISLIIGLPFETKKMVRRTISFAKSLDCDLTCINRLLLYPSSRFCENSEQYKLKITGETLLAETSELSEEDINSLMREAFEELPRNQLSDMMRLSKGTFWQKTLA